LYVEVGNLHLGRYGSPAGALARAVPAIDLRNLAGGTDFRSQVTHRECLDRDLPGPDRGLDRLHAGIGQVMRGQLHVHLRIRPGFDRERHIAVRCASALRPKHRVQVELAEDEIDGHAIRLPVAFG
jgi:hypothetical protein